MEDLVTFLIFLVIVGINAIKFFAEKGKRKKPSQQEGEAPAKKPPSSIEAFFESLAEQVAPKPTELPDWPEDHERPDYQQEMTEFDRTHAGGFEEERTAEIIPMPEPFKARTPEIRDFQRHEAPAPVQRSMKAGNAILSGSQGMRMPSNHNTSAAHPDFRIKGRKNLKQAMLAHVVFSPPRSHDLSFDPLRQHR